MEGIESCMIASYRTKAHGLLLLVIGLFFSTSLFAQEDLTYWLKKVQQASLSKSYYGDIQYFRAGRSIRQMTMVHMAEQNYAHEMIRGQYEGQVELVKRETDLSLYAVDQSGEVRNVRLLSYAGPNKLSADQIENIARYYQAKSAGVAVVAGRKTDLIIFQPVHNDRYEYRAWIDRQTGILMGASRRNEKGEVVESFYFTRFVSGAKTKEQLADFYRVTSKEREKNTAPLANSEDVRRQWDFVYLPEGFFEIKTQKRQKTAGSMVDQWFFSDGINTLSVFFKPINKAGNAEVYSEQRGAGSVAIRQDMGFEIVVIGEVPIASALKVVNAIRQKN